MKSHLHRSTFQLYFRDDVFVGEPGGEIQAALHSIQIRRAIVHEVVDIGTCGNETAALFGGQIVHEISANATHARSNDEPGIVLDVISNLDADTVESLIPPGKLVIYDDTNWAAIGKPNITVKINMEHKRPSMIT